MFSRDFRFVVVNQRYSVVDFISENISQHAGDKGILVAKFDQKNSKFYLAIMDKGEGFLVDEDGKPIIEYDGDRFKQVGSYRQGSGGALGAAISLSKDLVILTQGHRWSKSNPVVVEEPRVSGLQGTLVFVEIELSLNSAKPGDTSVSPGGVTPADESVSAEDLAVFSKGLSREDIDALADSHDVVAIEPVKWESLQQVSYMIEEDTGVKLSLSPGEFLILCWKYLSELEGNAIDYQGSQISEVYKEMSLYRPKLGSERFPLLHFQVIQNYIGQDNLGASHWATIKKLEEQFNALGQSYFHDYLNRKKDGTSHGDGIGFEDIGFLMEKAGIYLEYRRTEIGRLVTNIWVDLSHLFNQVDPDSDERDSGGSLSGNDDSSSSKPSSAAGSRDGSSKEGITPGGIALIEEGSFDWDSPLMVKPQENTEGDSPLGITPGGIDFNPDALEMSVEKIGTVPPFSASQKKGDSPHFFSPQALPFDLEQFEGFTFQILKIQRIDELTLSSGQ